MSSESPQLTPHTVEADSVFDASLTLDPEAPDNRPQLFRALEDRITTVPGEFALVMVDLDGLKDINEEYTHEEGDKYLEYVRKLLSDLTREGDEIITVHINGDEFGIILGRTSNEAHVTDFINRMQRDLAEYGVEASMGGRVHNAGESFSELYKAADMLMQENDHERKLVKSNSLPPDVRAVFVNFIRTALAAHLSPRTAVSLGMAAALELDRQSKL